MKAADVIAALARTQPGGHPIPDAFTLAGQAGQLDRLCRILADLCDRAEHDPGSQPWGPGTPVVTVGTIRQLIAQVQP